MRCEYFSKGGSIADWLLMFLLSFLFVQEFVLSPFIYERHKVDKDREKYSGDDEDVDTEKIDTFHKRSS
jgi:hypothetical protein